MALHRTGKDLSRRYGQRVTRRPGANRTLHLLLSISVNYALLGDKEYAMEFFERQIGQGTGELEAVGVGQDAGREELNDFLEQMGPNPS